MSWSASGTIEGKQGPDEMWSDDLNFSPSRDQLADAPTKQVEFVMSFIGTAFSEGVIDGKYSCSLSGHDDPDQENNRKRLSISLSPIT
jgi:hypothetical protein